MLKPQGRAIREAVPLARGGLPGILDSHGFKSFQHDVARHKAEENGAVVTSTINKYVYLALHAYFGRMFLLKYSSTELVERPEDIQHP